MDELRLDTSAYSSARNIFYLGKLGDGWVLHISL